VITASVHVGVASFEIRGACGDPGEKTLAVGRGPHRRLSPPPLPLALAAVAAAPSTLKVAVEKDELAAGLRAAAAFSAGADARSSSGVAA
jgi:hypothetical protein